MRSLFCFMLATLLLSTTLSAQEAAQWRGQHRDGVYTETGLLRSWPALGPKLLWHNDSIGEGHASASVVSHDLVYTAGLRGGKGHVFAFTLDGKLVWDTPYGDEWSENFPGTRSTPLIHEGKVYLMSAFGKIVCLSADKGNLLWSADLMKEYDGRNIVWGVTENLLIDGDKLFITLGGTKNNVIALHKDTGKLIWSSEGNGEVSAYGSPLLITLPARKVLITMTEKSILGLDAATGKKLWSHEQINQWAVHANTPVYSNGMLYCVSGYGCGGVMLKLSADGSSIETAWNNADLDSRMGGVVLVNDKIYGMGDKVKGLHCIDWNTGKELAFDKFNNKFGSIIAADGMLYVYDESGEVALVEPTLDGFKKVSGFKVPFGSAQHWAHPVIDNGRLYIRHGNSLMVYDIRK
ncbi:MAG: PQQ-binding-like beta-propeller repeat protein [Bacteroidota bacterium]